MPDLPHTLPQPWIDELHAFAREYVGCERALGRAFDKEMVRMIQEWMEAND